MSNKPFTMRLLKTWYIAAYPSLIKMVKDGEVKSFTSQTKFSAVLYETSPNVRCNRSAVHELFGGSRSAPWTSKCFLKWGYTNNGLFKMDNPIYKWMMTGGSPMTQEPPPIWQYWIERGNKFHVPSTSGRRASINSMPKKLSTYSNSTRCQGFQPSAMNNRETYHLRLAQKYFLKKNRKNRMLCRSLSIQPPYTPLYPPISAFFLSKIPMVL